MKNHRFSLLKDRCLKADALDPVWWTGALFTELTKKQVNKLIDLIAEQQEVNAFDPTYEPVCEVFYIVNTPYKVKLPSGLILLRG